MELDPATKTLELHHVGFQYNVGGLTKFGRRIYFQKEKANKESNSDLS